jgi:hypothetical protein
MVRVMGEGPIREFIILPLTSDDNIENRTATEAEKAQLEIKVKELKKMLQII